MKYRAIFTSALLLAACIAGITAMAQTTLNEPDTIPGGPVTLSQLFLVVSPEQPKPNSSATVEVKSNAFDIGRVEIEWYENGKLVDGGVGRTKHGITTGRAGTSMTVMVLVKKADGEVVQESIIIRPATVDLIWQTSSTLPPFYKGKALYTLFGKLKIIAMPEVLNEQGRRIPDSELFYKWEKKNEILGKLSGYGRNTLTLETPELRHPLTASVSVSLSDGTVVAGGAIEINTSEPKVFVYENSPLYGILFNRELGGRATLSGQEVVFDVFPFFFNIQNRNALSYMWFVNGENMTNFTGPDITLRKTGTESGNAQVYVRVSNKGLFTENITKSIDVALKQ